MSRLIERLRRTSAAWIKETGAADGLASLLTEAADALASRSSPEWQPIDSAPKDGTRIIAIEDFEREDDEGRKYPRDCEVVKWSEAAGAWVAFGIGLSSFEPTHWRPLDPPPSRT